MSRHRGKHVLAVALLLAGCSTAADTPDDEATSAGQALCEAAGEDSLDGAHAAFARAHDGLHTLARDLQDDDQREVAALLLEAKGAVETDVADNEPLETLSPHLDELLETVDAATTALDRPAPPCR